MPPSAERKLSSSTTGPSSHVSIAQKIPPEVFVAVCDHLTPTNLLSLSWVCRRYRELLSSETSSVTQQIWRRARLEHLPDYKLPPPQGVSEQRYILLSNSASKCQFCGGKESDVYWVFRVRCCIECLVERTVSKSKLLKDGYISKAVIACLPYIHPCGYPLYWYDSVISAQIEFNNLTPAEMSTWFIQKHEFAKVITRDAKVREAAFNHQQYQRQVNIGYQIGYSNWRRRAATMLKELGQEFRLDTRNVVNSQTYKNWECCFDPEWEEDIWQAWKLAMKRVCLKTNKRKTFTMRLISKFYHKWVSR